MGAKIIVVGGPNEGETYEMAEDSKATIGRGDSANFRLTDPTVSRVHCVVEYYGGQGVVKDCASKTGTKINGIAVAHQVLRPQAVITLGNTQVRFMPDPPPPPAPKVEDEEEKDPEELVKLSGTRLAHFDIGEVVAVGSSGVVFKANDFKDNREVALKVYLPEFAENDVDVQRFIRAVKTMLPMRHPNLVTLYGGGKTGPYCWMSMEYVEGESLTETIARIGRAGKIDWRVALRIATDIGRGLFYIHSESIIHRSLSPGNILHTRLGETKLGSLILAKALSGRWPRM